MSLHGLFFFFSICVSSWKNPPRIRTTLATRFNLYQTNKCRCGSRIAIPHPLGSSCSSYFNHCWVSKAGKETMVSVYHWLLFHSVNELPFIYAAGLCTFAVQPSQVTLLWIPPPLHGSCVSTFLGSWDREWTCCLCHIFSFSTCCPNAF